MIEFLTKVIVILCVIAIMGVVLALPVMLLWNWVMPDIFNLPTIDFWHALGLSLLSCCLFNWGNGSSKKK